MLDREKYEYLKSLIEKMDEKTTLGELQKYCSEMEDIRGFSNNSEYEVLAFLIEELGELSKEIRKKNVRYMEEGKDKNVDIEGELADVFMYILSMSRIMKVDLLKAFRDKEMKNLNRVWK